MGLQEHIGNLFDLFKYNNGRMVVFVGAKTYVKYLFGNKAIHFGRIQEMDNTHFMPQVLKGVLKRILGIQVQVTESGRVCLFTVTWDS